MDSGNPDERPRPHPVRWAPRLLLLAAAAAFLAPTARPWPSVALVVLAAITSAAIDFVLIPMRLRSDRAASRQPEHP